jgi:hypothetical protein
MLNILLRSRLGFDEASSDEGDRMFLWKNHPKSCPFLLNLRHKSCKIVFSVCLIQISLDIIKSLKQKTREKNGIVQKALLEQNFNLI